MTIQKCWEIQDKQLRKYWNMGILLLALYATQWIWNETNTIDYNCRGIWTVFICAFHLRDQK